MSKTSSMCQNVTTKLGLSTSWATYPFGTSLVQSWKLKSCIWFLSKTLSYMHKTNPEKNRFLFHDSDQIPSILHQNLLQMCREGNLKKALKIFCSLDFTGASENPQIFSPLLRICIDSGALKQGKFIHHRLILSGLIACTVLNNHLIILYSKYGRLADAYQVFEKMPQRNEVSWTVLISGYVQGGFFFDALWLYFGMRREGLGSDPFVLSVVFRACGGIGSLPLGRQIHANLIKFGSGFSVFLGNVVADMYVKCDDLQDAEKFLLKMTKKNVVSWTTVIAGYAHNRDSSEGLKLFVKMIRQGICPDQSAFASVLRGCSVENLKQGLQLHGFALKTGFELDVIVGCAIIDLYLKFSRLEDAHQLFDRIHERNVVTWTAMIVGYVHNKRPIEALELFVRMQLSGIKSDEFTFSGVLRACANGTALEQGRQVHIDVIKRGLELDPSVSNALVDMYGKCGDIEDAIKVFEQLSTPDLASWNSMIIGFSKHGRGIEAIGLFEQMLQNKVNPDSITFVSLLSGCSHCGLVEEAQSYFRMMTQAYKITPKEEHYSCMVDLLGRAGLVEEALKFIQEMDVKAGDSVWGALLGACSVHGNLEAAERAAKELMEMMPENPIIYISMANAYAAAGRWDSAAKMRKLMADRGIKKDPGCTWIQMENKVHVFTVEDQSHPQRIEIHDVLAILSIHMREVGYMFQPKYILHHEIFMNCE